MKKEKDYYNNFDSDTELLNNKENYNKDILKESSNFLDYEEKKFKPVFVNGEVIMVPDDDTIDYTDNKQNSETHENLILFKEKLKERYDIEDSVDIKDLEQAFIIFGGDYITYIENFDSMTDEEKKLFIIYSLFHFNMRFDQENMEGIVSDQVLNEIRKLANEFTKYGSYTGCSLEFGNSIYGPVLSGIGHNMRVPLKTNKAFKNLDLFELSDLVAFASKGYKYTESLIDQEARTMDELNEKLQKELQAFDDLIKSLLTKRR